jgi:hypothetical protein
MKKLDPPKVTPDMPLDELIRILSPIIMLNALKEDDRLLFILGVLKFDVIHLGEKLQAILYQKYITLKHHGD